MSSASSRTESSNSSAEPTFTDDMKGLSTILRRLSRKKEFNEFSKIRDKNRDLEKRLAAKETEIEELQSAKETEIEELRSAKETEIKTLQSAKAKLQLEKTALKSAKDALFAGFEEKYEEWRTKTNRQEGLEQKVATLQQQLTQANQRADSSEDTLENVQKQLEVHRGELIQCQNELREVNRKLENETEKLGRKQFELDGTRAQLQSLQDTLQTEKQELGLEELDLVDLAARFNIFVETSHGLARRFFFTELTESEDLTWKKISAELYQPDLIKIIPKKYPLSNSIQSKYLRMAIAEKIIAAIYHSDIFRQYYLPESDEIEKILNQLHKEYPRKEAIFRSQLHYAYKPGAEQDRVTRIVKSATEKAVGLLGPLLFAPDAEGIFRSDFERLLQDAADLWRPVQKSVVRGSVENEPDNTWDCHEEYHTAMKLSPDQEVHVPDEPTAIMSLFPQVVIGDSEICPGYALWSNQSTVVAASLESKSRNSINGLAGNSTAGIQRRGTTRRFSISGEDTPQSPRSPLGSPPALRHTHNRSVSLPRRGGTPGIE
ncbi:hypothetical protein BDZ45DRAFT_755694 [Acephala macrosclerotiorum]|nr:hypothetical protein BDZ45DRAFT_755694 [Acephala macrosclerotiorum]